MVDWRGFFRPVRAAYLDDKSVAIVEFLQIKHVPVTNVNSHVLEKIQPGAPESVNGIARAKDRIGLGKSLDVGENQGALYSVIG